MSATLNDLETNERCVKIRQLADTLQVLEREGKELALFIALSDIEKHAHEAQARLNEIKWKSR